MQTGFRYSILLILAIFSLVSFAGCGRRHYLRQADRETYATLGEKTAGAPWEPPASYSVYPDPRARFADPTDPAFPQLPPVGPRLYKSGFLDAVTANDSGEAVAPESGEDAGNGESSGDLGTGDPAFDEEIEQVEGIESGAVLVPPRPGEVSPTSSSMQSASWVEEEAQPESRSGEAERELTEQDLEEDRRDEALKVVPVARSDWDALPESCRRWMLEFTSVRKEFERTYKRLPLSGERVEAPRLSLPMVLELALIHSREYQTQKETLYRAALQLTLDRYFYSLRFTALGNGTIPSYVHSRAAGTTVNTLAVPTTLAGRQIMATGADLVTRFANDVVLTFNGPSGFSADVGSQMLLQLSQSFLQNDIVFEGLTQAERNVIYAARNFARFRKTFFRDLTNRYYRLLLTYRSIEIGSQDYFSNARAFHQGQAEHEANRLPRFQVDQFEQNALRSLSGLIRSANTLERSLDDFKLQIGLPPELLIHIDLAELERLTARDEATVREELVRRARRTLVQQRGSSAPDPAVLLSQGIELARRLLLLDEAHRAAGREARGAARDELSRQLAELRADEAWYLVGLTESAHRATAKGDAPIVQQFQRTMEVVNALRIAIARERTRRRLRKEEPAGDLLQTARELYHAEALLRERLVETVASRQLDQIEVLAGEAEKLLARAESVAGRLRRIKKEQWRDAEWLRGRVEEVIASADAALGEGASGLQPFELEHDAALLTSVARRWDLANRREQVADAWRQIKFAADRMRSVIDVTASQSIRTPDSVNRVFDFGWDDSTTQLRLRFDTPLNRQAERNAYRRALLSYQAALRSWIEAEDRIKRDVRDDLRRLQLDRQQYEIAVASAALAQERVVSTRLQLQLGIGRVAARDFLEAQQAYTASLSAVAAEHIGFLTDRIALFLDMEQLTVDERGIWPYLYDERYQAEADYRLEQSGRSPYGQLAPGVWHSHRLREMLRVPSMPPQVLEEEESVEVETGVETDVESDGESDRDE